MMAKRCGEGAGKRHRDKMCDDGRCLKKKKKTQSKTTEQQRFKDIMCESRIQLRQALAERVNHRRALLFVP